MHVKRPESVLVVLYNQDNNVLVLQRMDDPTFYQSVTGSMEENESPIQTALREVYEEVGIHLNLGHGKNNILADCRLVNQYCIREDWRHRYEKGVTKNFEYVFCAQIDKAADIKLSEHLSYQWMTKPLAIEKVWSKSNKYAIEKFVPEKRWLDSI